MADLKLKSVRMQNWMRYKDTSVNFPESGLVLVLGDNVASKGNMLSVGSGKTSIGEAVCRTLFGSKGRFIHAKRYSTRKKGNMLVTVTAEHLGKELVVEYGYGRKDRDWSGEGLRYSYNGSPFISRSRIDETRTEISNIVGVTPLLSDWTVFVRGKNIAFDQLTEEQSLNIVMASLRQPPWNRYQEGAKTLLAKARTDLDAAEARLSSIQGQQKVLVTGIAQSERLVQVETQAYKQRLKEAESTKTRIEQELKSLTGKIEACVVRKKDIQARIREIESEKAKASHKLEIEKNELDDAMHAAQEERNDAFRAVLKAQNSVEGIKRKIAEMKAVPKDCPTCGKPWDKAHGEVEFKQVRQKLEEAQSVEKEASAVVHKIDDKMRNLRLKKADKARELSALSVQSEVTSLSDDYQRIDANQSALDRKRHGLEIEKANTSVSDSALCAAQASLDTKKQQEAALASEAERLTRDISDFRQAHKIASYWVKAYSPVGIPNMILSEVIAPLNLVSAAVSNRVTGGMLEVNCQTQKQLANGTMRNEIVISVENDTGSDEADGSSNGEASLTNFILAETFSEVGNVSSRAGFRWYDEVAPYHDPVLAKKIYSYMRETARKLGILVFLVDHNPVAENYADHILVAEKKASDASAYWR